MTEQQDKLGLDGVFGFGLRGEIFQIMPVLMGEIGEIPKLRKRKIFGEGSGDGNASFAFRGIDDALNACGPLFAKHKVTPSVQAIAPKNETMNCNDKNGKPIIVNRSELQIALTLIASDGSWVRHICGGMATDKNDNTSSNKAHSAGMKYAMFLGLAIPVEREAIDDGDDDEGAGEIETVTKASNAIRPSNRPGDDKSEQVTQDVLVRIKNQYAQRDVTKLKTAVMWASNNAMLNEAQRAVIIKTATDYMKALKANPTGDARTEQPTQSKPAAGTRPQQSTTKTTTPTSKKEGN